MRELERLFERDYPGFRAVVTFRGTTALTLALASVRRRRGDGEVIVPSTVCPNVPLAAVYAGLTPRFADVEPETLCLSARTVAPCLSPSTRAVVVVHTFGKAAPMDELAALAASAPSRPELVDDAAQAVGGSLGGRPLGSLGDYGVLSFDETKILDGKAGVLLVRDGHDDPERLERESRALPAAPPSAELASLATSFRDATHGLYDRLRTEGLSEAHVAPPELWERFRPLFLARPDDDPALLLRNVAGRAALAATIEDRRLAYLEYERAFAGRVPHVRFSASETCWRLPLLAPDHAAQRALVAALRGQGILASNHYFPISYLFGQATGGTAREVGLRAVQLWVDAKLDRARLPAAVETVARVFAG